MSRPVAERLTLDALLSMIQRQALGLPPPVPRCDVHWELPAAVTNERGSWCRKCLEEKP